jgi:hypothetical protein
MPKLGTGGLIAAAAIVGALSAFLLTEMRSAMGSAHSEGDLHSFLHATIKLDPAEDGRLGAKEAAYDARRREIEERLRAANAQLAEAIEIDPRWSPKVEAASREVEAAAGDLQRTTLVHVFEMRDGLDAPHRAAYDRALLDALKRGAK